MGIDAGRRKLMRTAGAAGVGVLGAFVLLRGTAQTGGATGDQPNEVVVKIVAKKFEYSPDIITLKVGQPVVLELISMDVTMGFSAFDLGLRTDIVPEKVTRLHFTPDKVGRFLFSCDVFCGSGHEDMSGVIVVTA
jgi:cytochrome c oxidase subunit 2